MLTPERLNRCGWVLALAIFTATAPGCTSDATEDEYSQSILKQHKATGFYDFNYPAMDGQEVSLGRYRGKVVLIVNTASRCGYTGQYEGLQKLHEKYAGRGLAVIGLPCNQFFGQEPGENLEIATFCRENYGVTFPLSQKVEVNGENKLPLYAWLTNADAAFPGKISWNFNKFLIDRNGKVVARFSTGTGPEEEEVVKAIEKALAENPRTERSPRSAAWKTGVDRLG